MCFRQSVSHGKLQTEALSQAFKWKCWRHCREKIVSDVRPLGLLLLAGEFRVPSNQKTSIDDVIAWRQCWKIFVHAAICYATSRFDARKIPFVFNYSKIRNTVTLRVTVMEMIPFVLLQHQNKIHSNLACSNGVCLAQLFNTVRIFFKQSLVLFIKLNFPCREAHL